MWLPAISDKCPTLLPGAAGGVVSQARWWGDTLSYSIGSLTWVWRTGVNGAPGSTSQQVWQRSLPRPSAAPSAGYLCVFRRASLNCRGSLVSVRTQHRASPAPGAGVPPELLGQPG